MACFLPFRPFLSRTLGSSMGNRCGPRLKGLAASFHALTRHLGRFVPLFAATASALPSQLRWRYGCTSLKLFGPTAFPVPMALLSASPFEVACRSFCLRFGKYRTRVS
jgi:hypothetical protein